MKVTPLYPLVNPRTSPSSQRPPARPARILASSIALCGLLSATALITSSTTYGAILDQYTFGTVAPGVLTPTTVDLNVTASNITADTGLALDLTSPATAPATSPYLRTTFNTLSTSAAAAVTNNADFKFTLTANLGFQLNLSSLTFDAMRGGAGTPRGYEVRSSADNFATALASADIPTVRPTLTPVFIDLTGIVFQGLNAITFKIYSYSPAVGSSVDYDSIVVNGTAAPLGFSTFTWTGAVNGNWNTTTANWSGNGTTYVDGAPNSDVLFDDTGANSAITVVAAGLNPKTVTFSNSTAKSYSLSGGSVTAATSFAKNGTGPLTINNAVSAPLAEINVGTVTLANGSSFTAGTLTVNQQGLLVVNTGGTLAATTGLIVNGAATFNTPAQALASLAGGTSGALTLNGTALEVTGAGTYAGAITGSGSLLKSGSGALTLGGPNANTYTGTTTVTGGSLTLGKTGGVNAVPGNITTSGGGGVTLGGANQIPDTADVTIGDLTSGGFFRTAGNADTFRNLTITVPVGSPYNTTNNVTSVLNNLTITGTLSITNGEHDIVGSNTSLTASSLILNGTVQRLGANSNPSTVNVGSSGLNMTGSSFTFGTPGAAFTAQINLGGDFTGSGINNFNVTNTLGSRVLDLTGANRTFSILDGTTTITPVIQNGGITKTGDGALVLQGLNAYTGPTVVNAGSLVVSGDISASATTVTGGSIGGIGKFGVVALNGGRIAPGNNFGALNTNDLTLTSGALALEIGGNSPGLFDQLNVIGVISLLGSIDLVLDFSTYDPADGSDQFTILLNDGSDAISFGGTNARFSYAGLRLDEGRIFTATSGTLSQPFRISYVGGDGNDVVLSAVPEPNTLSLLAAFGGSALGLRRVRRKRG